MGQGIDGGVHSSSQRPPAGSVPHSDPVAVRITAGVGEIPADVYNPVGDDDGVDDIV